MAGLLASRLVRIVQDFPQPGIAFRDVTPVLRDPQAFQEAVDRMVEWASVRSPNVVVGIESRGFLFGAPVALALGVSFVPVRKAGKLPFDTLREEYALEYGAAVLEIHRDALAEGQRVLIVDDLLATGGTAAAAIRLVEALGGDVAGLSFLIELEALRGRGLLKSYEIQALLSYP